MSAYYYDVFCKYTIYNIVQRDAIISPGYSICHPEEMQLRFVSAGGANRRDPYDCSLF